jgi:putative transposase
MAQIQAEIAWFVDESFFCGDNRGRITGAAPAVRGGTKEPMKQGFRYRIFPTKHQEATLRTQLSFCCELYNAGLEERREAYRMGGKSIPFTEQSAQLPDIKELRPEYRAIYSQVLQDVLRRLDKAFKAFFRRVKSGEVPGYPRFKAWFRYNSLTYPQSGFGIEPCGPAPQGKNRQAKQWAKLTLAKIGSIWMNMHRPFKGVIKTCTIVRSSTGKWYVSISCDEVEPEPPPESDEEVGIDVGLKTFAYLSTGEQIENPRFFRKEEQALTRAQRRLSKAGEGTRKRKKRRKVVARIHERIKNRRQNFIQQQVAWLIKRFGFIAVEALTVRNMVKNPRLSKSIADAAWSMFFTHLILKAEEAARCVVKVPPAYTSQTCSVCGHKQNMPLSVRVYDCEACETVLHRDQNASRTILGLGRQARVIPEAPV